MLDVLSVNSVSDLLERQLPVLVAVSGGSDSTALLHWLVENYPAMDLHVATVDHRLRPESTGEAEAVATMCRRLNLPHATLVWHHDVKATSAEARHARYELLRQHASSLGAAAIALGHTMNDQAETVFMRAQRARPHSDTRGLSGIAEWSTFKGLRLWRPLLPKTRVELRTFLRSRGIAWIEDPSNQDPGYERIRVRKLLDRKTDLQVDVAGIAQLAGLAARSRRWMNRRVADIIRNNVDLDPEGGVLFLSEEGTPKAVVQEVLVVLVLAVGGLPHRVPSSKLSDLTDAITQGKAQTITLGRCLISARDGRVNIQRESRNLPPFPHSTDKKFVYDGRILVQPSASGSGICQKTFISSLENYRPETDDKLYVAVRELLDSAPRST